MEMRMTRLYFKRVLLEKMVQQIECRAHFFEEEA